MVVGRDRWEGRTRIVEAIKALRDVAVVVSPAYPAAVAELRNAPDAPPSTDHEEPAMPDETPIPEPVATGGLVLENRTADDALGTVESRVLDAMAAVPKGEARSLTHATAEPVEPTDIQTSSCGTSCAPRPCSFRPACRSTRPPARR